MIHIHINRTLFSTVSFLFLLLLCQNSVAQNKGWLPGKVVFKDGKKSTGKIEYNAWSKNRRLRGSGLRGLLSGGLRGLSRFSRLSPLWLRGLCRLSTRRFGRLTRLGRLAWLSGLLRIVRCRCGHVCFVSQSCARRVVEFEIHQIRLVSRFIGGQQ